MLIVLPAAQMVKLSAFKPFGSAADALEQVNAISESQLTDELKSFLEMNLPKVVHGMCRKCCMFAVNIKSTSRVCGARQLHMLWGGIEAHSQPWR